MASRREADCLFCHEASVLTSQTLRVCPSCVRDRWPEARGWIAAVHAESRAAFGLPERPPGDTDGALCNLCANECRIGEGGRGFCGLRTVRDGRLVHLAGTPARGHLQWYRDPLPTNCVAEWVCGGGRHAGSHNLAVFYRSCTANCLYCQNWHYRGTAASGARTLSARQLASAAESDTFCVCYFGGDPGSQMPHALAASKELAARGVRVCWETNGMMHPKLLDAAVRLSLRTGGCVKFDLKAFDGGVHEALAGVSNRRTLENLARAAARLGERPEPPLVVASTLLVPGYVDAEEVGRIARFLAGISPRIPYSLLGFGPAFLMGDLPCTSLEHAEEAEAAARDAGLERVRIANRHLLGLGRA
jgi:pyruvate formate lyase activating enzyme